jgi:hypothetical protein
MVIAMISQKPPFTAYAQVYSHQAPVINSLEHAPIAKHVPILGGLDGINVEQNISFHQVLQLNYFED